MEIKNPFRKKDGNPHRPEIKSDSVVKRPADKVDRFESALVLGTGLLIGALGAYLIITYPVT